MSLQGYRSSSHALKGNVELLFILLPLGVSRKRYTIHTKHLKGIPHFIFFIKEVTVKLSLIFFAIFNQTWYYNSLSSRLEREMKRCRPLLYHLLVTSPGSVQSSLKKKPHTFKKLIWCNNQYVSYCGNFDTIDFYSCCILILVSKAFYHRFFVSSVTKSYRILTKPIFFTLLYQRVCCNMHVSDTE